jgi:hypothetical protein
MLSLCGSGKLEVNLVGVLCFGQAVGALDILGSSTGESSAIAPEIETLESVSNNNLEVVLANVVFAIPVNNLNGVAIDVAKLSLYDNLGTYVIGLGPRASILAEVVPTVQCGVVVVPIERVVGELLAERLCPVRTEPISVVPREADTGPSGVDTLQQPRLLVVVVELKVLDVCIISVLSTFLPIANFSLSAV